MLFAEDITNFAKNNFRISLLVGSALLGVQPAAAHVAGDSVSSAADVAAASSDASDSAPAAEIVVTAGSRSGTTEFKSTSPVSVVSGATLGATAQPDLRTALAAVAPSFIALNGNNGSSSSKPVRTAALRGLTGFHTLVLVDGIRRHQTALLNNTTGTTGAPADLSFIPLDAIDHVEVLSDGASAQYGSDAIAGVVNIILKKNPTGGSAYAQAGLYDTDVAAQGGQGQHGFTDVFGVNQGFKLGKDGGFIRLAGEYRHIDLSNVTGPIEAWASGVPLSNIYAAPSKTTQNPLDVSANRYRQINEVVPFGYAWNLAANAELPLSSDITAYANATYGQNSLSSTGTFRSENNVANIIVGAPGTLGPYGSPAGGYLPTLDTKQTDFQVDAGLRGENLLGWKWDLDLSDAANIGNMYVNGINASFGGTTPYHEFYIGKLENGQFLVNLDLQRKFNTPWGEGPLSIAWGGEFRRDSFAEGAGEANAYQNGGFIFPSNYPSWYLAHPSTGAGTQLAAAGSPFMTGFTPDEAGSWSRHSFAGYVDFSQNLTSKLRLALAGRVENYSDFGTRVTGKASARYEIAPGFALRATVNNGFRAPSLAEEYTTVLNQGPNTVNGVSTQVNTYNSVRFTNPYAAALGATALKPETSINYSVGFVAKPISNLNLSLDAYQIDINNRIALTGQFNPTLNATVFTNLTNAGLTNVNSWRFQYFANIGNTRTRGIEFKGNYSADLGRAGSLDLIASAAYNEQKVTSKVNSSILNGPLLQPVGQVAIERGNPNLIAKAGFDWKLHQFDFRLTETYYSSTTGLNSNHPTIAADNAYQSGAYITDVAASLSTSQNIKLTIGANNLFNRTADNYSATYVSTGNQTVGATYPLPVPSAFGQGGRFVYARVGVTW